MVDLLKAIELDPNNDTARKYLKQLKVPGY